MPLPSLSSQNLSLFEMQEIIDNMNIMQLSLCVYHSTHGLQRPPIIASYPLSLEDMGFFNKLVNATLKEGIETIKKSANLPVYSELPLYKQPMDLLRHLKNEVAHIKKNRKFQHFHRQLLTYVDLSDESLSIQDALSLVRALDRIILDFTFEKLPRDRHATIIDLTKLGLTRLPHILIDELEKYSNLEYLVLNNNKLGFIPPNIAKLRTLRCLYLANNPIQTLPGSLEELQDLRLLDLKNTNLTHLPACLEYIVKCTNNSRLMHLLDLPSNTQYPPNPSRPRNRQGIAISSLSPGSICRNRFTPMFSQCTPQPLRAAVPPFKKNAHLAQVSSHHTSKTTQKIG